MNNSSHYLDTLLFAVLPYVTFFTFFLVTIQRYRVRTFTYSSLSSQFLENQHHFWSMVPFHYGILGVLTGHFLGFLIPREVLLWNSVPLRLYVLETTGLVLGLLTLIGLVAAVVRRMTVSKVHQVTTGRDWLLFALLAVQVISGIAVAIFYPWGSSWFASSASPYFWSILKLNPDVSYVSAMPHLVKLHIINAYVMIGFFPFTRMVHILVVPNPYLWRKPQVVRWHRAPQKAN